MGTARRLHGKITFACLFTALSPLCLHAAGSQNLPDPVHPFRLDPATHWMASQPDKHDSAPQIHVLRATPSARIVPPGSMLNITASFYVSSRVVDDYTLDLSLVNSQGSVLLTKRNTLNNNLLILPTSRWLGPVAITLPFAIPAGAKGTYSIMLTMEGPHGPVALSASEGVGRDGANHFSVGGLTVQSSAAEPLLAPPTKFDVSGLTLTFEDNFKVESISDSARFDHSRWYTQNEQCCLTASDGALTKMAPRASAHNPFSIQPNGLVISLQRNGDTWTSGVLTSVDSKGVGFSQKYGYFEMRARFPAGLNTWPAFWLLSTESKSSGATAGEIDIVEYIANPSFQRYVATTLHDWSNRTTPAMSHYMVDLPTFGFHTYGMLWTSLTMTFFYDGYKTFQCPTPAIMHQPYYLLVDLGLGAGWPTNETPEHNELEVQYIRAYRQR